MAHNKERLASFIKKELGIFLQKNFPRDLEIFLSISRVTLDTSSENAMVYISVFPASSADKPAIKNKELWKNLKNFQREAQQYLSQQLKRRRVPKIIFVEQDIEKEAKLEKLLEKVKNE